MKWAPIPNYAGYEITENGEVRSWKRGKARIKAQKLDRCGYWTICVGRNAIQSYPQVHILVAETFLGPRPTGYWCRHLDGVSTNNHVSNLQWGTPRENFEDTARHGKLKGENNAAAKLSEVAVRAIRKMLDNGVSQKEVGRVIGISESAVGRISKNECWAHVL